MTSSSRLQTSKPASVLCVSDVSHTNRMGTAQDNGWRCEDALDVCLCLVCGSTSFPIIYFLFIAIDEHKPVLHDDDDNDDDDDDRR